MSTREEPPKNTYVISTESGAEMARLIDQDLALTEAIGLLPKDVIPREGDQILDVACGPGGWARNVATRYPQAEVVGIDISQTMTTYANAYVQAQQMPNLSFQVMDVTKPWSFADSSFDIVSARAMVGFLTREKWLHVISEMLRVLVPGGTLIITEPDESGRTNSLGFEQSSQYLFRAAKSVGLSQHPLGLNFGATPMLGYFLRQAGCEQLQQEALVLDYSAGTPAHPIMVEDFKAGYKLVQPFITKTGEATQEQLDDAYELMLKEWNRPDFRALMFLLRVWGKKPSQS